MTRVCGGMCEEEEIRASNEGYPKVPEDFTITEKASTRAFSWLNNRVRFRAVHNKRRRFEAPRGMPKADDRLT